MQDLVPMQGEQNKPQRISGAWIQPLLFLLAIMLMLLVAYWPAFSDSRYVGDLLLYRQYAYGLLAHPMQLPQEYPPPVAILFLVPQLIAPQHYFACFAILMALITWLVVLLIERLSGRGWWMLLCLVLGSGGTVFFRYDMVVVGLTLLAFAAASRRYWLLAHALLVLGVVFKLYPLILMPLVVIEAWRVERRVPWVSTLGGGALLMAAVGGIWLFDPTVTTGMLHYHSARGLEYESLGASLIWLTEAMRSLTIEWTYGSINIVSHLTPTIIAGLTASNLLLLIIYVYFGAGRLRAGGAWALVLMLAIATSKVFSAQYFLWSLPFVVVAGGPGSGAVTSRRAMGYRWLWLVICVLTTLIYPVGFGAAESSLRQMIMPAWMMALVTARNGLWLIAGMCGLTLWWKIPRNSKTVVKHHEGSKANVLSKI